MNLLDKIDPYLTSDDIVVRHFALHALRSFPAVKPEWPTRLLRAAIEKPKHSFFYLLALDNMTLGSEDIPLLAEAIKSGRQERRHMFVRAARSLPLQVKMENRDELGFIFSDKEWAFFIQLEKADKKGLEQMLEKLLAEMESLDHYEQELFMQAKDIAHRQVEQGWVDTAELQSIIQQQKEQPYFDYEGFIAVYKIGLIKDENFIEELAPLLLRDEDILLEELAAALISFQSDKVVEGVEPYLTGEYPIFQVDIISKTFSPAAIASLKRLYKTVDDIDLKSVIIEGLAEQLAAEGRHEIEDFMTYDVRGNIYDTEELAYGYYTIMQFEHPELENWKRNATANIERNRQPIQSPLSILKPSDATTVRTITPAVSDKVGRNDPCPCGSGKKYKKCHGK